MAILHNSGHLLFIARVVLFSGLDVCLEKWSGAAHAALSFGRSLSESRFALPKLRIKQPWFFAAIFVLTATSRLSGAVLWLELGSSEQPALDADGIVLTVDSIQAMGITARNSADEDVGQADLSGLDSLGSGFFIGVICIPDCTDTNVSLHLGPTTDGQSADLGESVVESDDFTPYVDPAAYRIICETLTWPGIQRYLQVSIEGYGSVSDVADVYEANTTVTLIPEPYSGWELREWLGNIPETDRQADPLELVMTRDYEITAVFQLTIPDSWIEKYFGTDAVDLDDDPDEDGYSSRQEYANGTDPLSNAAVTATLSLVQGWNLISLPLQPAVEITPDTVFGDSAETIPIWYCWNPYLQAYTTPVTLGGKQGYWVFSLEDHSEIQITGQPIVDGTLYCYVGWNLIGPAVSEMFPSATLSQEPTIWGWDTEWQTYQSVNSTSLLEPGLGYWVHLVENVILDGFF